MAKKVKVDFAGFKEAAEKLDRLGGDLRGATEEALLKSKRMVHKQVGQAMAPHNKTFGTIRSLVSDEKVTWFSTRAVIQVGFDLEHGGMPSIYLMFGTPKMEPDKKLYNSIYGSATKKKVRDLQEQIFNEAIRKVTG